MVSGIRSETNVSVSLANLYLWLARNRGGEVEVAGLDSPGPRRDASLRVGLPMTAARAVMCTIWLLEKQDGATPLLAGRLCGLINPRDGSVRLVLEGSAGPGTVRGVAPPTRENVRSEGTRLAGHLLELIAAACELEGEGRLTAWGAASADIIPTWTPINSSRLGSRR